MISAILGLAATATLRKAFSPHRAAGFGLELFYGGTAWTISINDTVPSGVNALWITRLLYGSEERRARRR
jgi:hypothetical protein